MSHSGGVSSGGLKRVPIALLVKRVLSSKVTEKKSFRERESIPSPTQLRTRTLQLRQKSWHSKKSIIVIYFTAVGKFSSLDFDKTIKEEPSGYVLPWRLASVRVS